MATMLPERNVFTRPAAIKYQIPHEILPPIKQISAFHSTLPGYSPTPIIPLPTLAKSLKIGELIIKDERSRFNVSSFKPLGIAWAIRNALIAELSESLPEPLPSDISLPDLAAKTKEAQIKLVTATDGKLGRIVARLGKFFGVESINTRIFVAGDLGEDARDAIKAEGAEVIVVTGHFEVAVREAWLHSVSTDGILVNIDAEENYEDIPKWIVEGYSTIFTELDAQLSTPPDLIVLPVGVGGLAQATITHYKSSTAKTDTKATRVLTVEPEVAACLHRSLWESKRTEVESKETILKNLKYGLVSEAAWKVLKEGVDISTVVNDGEVVEAAEELKKEGVEVGPCGGAVLAALKDILGRGLGELDEKSTVVLICTDGSEG